MKTYATVIIGALMALPLSTHGWTLTADFNSGELGTKADRGGDGFTGAGGNSVYSDEVVLEGEQSVKLTIEAGSTGYGKWGGVLSFPERLVSGDTVWYQVYTYFPRGFDHYAYGEGGRLKFMRIHTLSSSGDNRGYNDLYIDQKGSPTPFKFLYEGAYSYWTDVGDSGDLIVPDQWESYQVRLTLDDVPVASGGNAEIYIWKNGVLLEHIIDRPTLSVDSDYASRALLFTYWNGGAPKTQSMYADNIMITTDTPSGRDANGVALIPSSIPNPPAPIETLIIE